MAMKQTCHALEQHSDPLLREETQMRMSWKVGHVFGIDVYVHVTFLILLAWVGLSHYLLRHDWGDVAGGIAFIIVLFAIVVLHELGHALAGMLATIISIIAAILGKHH